MSKDTGQNIEFESVEPSFYARIPKMAIMDLDPYELALYCNYKQTASDAPGGECFKSNKTLSEETGMSMSKVKTARTALTQKGYITVTDNPDPSGVLNAPPTVKIVNVWPENLKRYGKGGGRTKTTPRPQNNHRVVTTQPQRITTEEEPTKNNKPQRTALRPASELNPIKDAIVNAFGWSWEKMSKTEKGRVQKTAAELFDANQRAENVPALYACCKRKYEQFGPNALCGVVSEVTSKPGKTTGTDLTALGDSSTWGPEQWAQYNQIMREGQS